MSGSKIQVINKCQDIKLKLIESGYDLDYYYYEAISHSKAYLPYTENDENQIIWMLDSKNELVSLSSCSQIVKALLKMKNQTNKRFIFQKKYFKMNGNMRCVTVFTCEKMG